MPALVVDSALVVADWAGHSRNSVAPSWVVLACSVAFPVVVGFDLAFVEAPALAEAFVEPVEV